MTLPPHSIFVNYRRSDSKYAVERICHCLTDAFGHDAVFCDLSSIRTGDDFPESIRQALANCRVFLTVIGKDWLRILLERNLQDGGPGRDWVREELEIACRRRETEGAERLLIYPLLLDAKMPCETDVPASLSQLPIIQGESIRVDRHFRTDIERIARTIGKHLGVAPRSDALSANLEFSPPRNESDAIDWTDELRTYGHGLFVGRDAELEALDRAWGERGSRVFSLWADGGQGKTRVVVKWLTRVRDDGWRGAGPVLVHSFYSQGCDERRNASSDFFFEHALKHFGYRGEPIIDATERGRKLASLVAERKGLLVLDGLEPLQHPPSFDEGRLKDTAIRALVLSLLNKPRGLCVITSRQPVVELRDRVAAAVVQQELSRLDPIAGSALLRQLEVRGTERELREAVEEFHGHAYSLMLLGTYLGETLDHDIRRRGEIPLLDEPDEATRLPGHSRRMFAAYVWHLGERSPEVAVLRLLGFFDRAVEMELIEVLRSREGVVYQRSPESEEERTLRQLMQHRGLLNKLLPPKPANASDELREVTAPLAGLSEKKWQRVLSRLAELRLIHLHERDATNEEAASSSLTLRGSVEGAIDSHALLREYFAEEVRTRFASAWRAGHRRLYEHLTARGDLQYFLPKFDPDTIDGLRPLYQAVPHGCLAGSHASSLAVYIHGILRGTGDDGFYSTKKLGAIGADLGAVACFFQAPWTAVSPDLSPAKQAWLLNQAAFRLRALGRLTEAVEPMRATVEMLTQAEDWKRAAQGAGNLSELELTRGAISAAVAAGAQSVMNADRSEDAFMRMYARTTNADALHQAGRIEEARRLFEEAEAIQSDRQPVRPRLYSVQGFRHCDLLLSTAERAAWRTLECGDLSPLSLAAESPSFDLPSDAKKEKVAPPRKESKESGDKSPHSKAYAAIIERAEYSLIIAERSRGLLDIALDHLTLGRAGLYWALLDASDRGQLQAALENPELLLSDPASPIPTDIAAAVTGLRAAGDVTRLPRGLLTRSWLRFLVGDVAGSREDLDEAWEIAERGPMPLFQADILLYRARLFARTQPYPWPTGPKADLAATRRLIEKHGYHRRDGELADAEQAARSWPNLSPSEPAGG